MFQDKTADSFNCQTGKIGKRNAVIFKKEIFRRFKIKKIFRTKRRKRKQAEKLEMIFRQRKEKKKSMLPSTRQTFFNSWRNAIHSPSFFLAMAKCHSLTNPFSASGKTPFARQFIFRQWQNATRSPTHFLSVAKRHVSANSISARGTKTSRTIFTVL